MKNFKKILAMVLAAVLLVVGSVAATVAYLTLTNVDPKLNVFSVGDISISVDEHVDTEGVAKVEKTTDEDGKVSGATYTDIMPGDKLIKEITVTNDGERPAYVALTVTVNHADIINKVLDEVYENEPYNYTPEQMQKLYDKVFEGWGLRYDHENRELGMRLTNQLPTDGKLLRVDSTKTTADYFFYAKDNWFQTEAEMNNTGYGLYPPADGYYAADMDANEWNYTYYLYLAPGESFTPFKGLNVPVEFNREQLAMFEGLKIEASASAIQAENTVSAKNAFAILAGDVDASGVVVSDAAGLSAALDAVKPYEAIILEGGDYGTVTIDDTLTNVTIDASGADSVERVIFAAGAKAEDVTITGLKTDTDITGGSYRGVVHVENGAEIKNLTIKDSYLGGSGDRSAAIGIQDADAEITVINCTFNGTKYGVYSSSIVPAKFTVEDCSFNNHSSWAILFNNYFVEGKSNVFAVNNSTFDNCQGLCKTLGTLKSDSVFAFTDNTITNSTGKDGKATEWFAISAGEGTVVVSGNKLDGAAWTPGTEQGLK